MDVKQCVACSAPRKKSKPKSKLKAKLASARKLKPKRPSVVLGSAAAAAEVDKDRFEGWSGGGGAEEEEEYLPDQGDSMGIATEDQGWAVRLMADQNLGKCRTCGALIKQDVDVVEAHMQTCTSTSLGAAGGDGGGSADTEGGSESKSVGRGAVDNPWLEGAQIRALSPHLLFGRQIQLMGGLTGTVLKMDTPKGWLAGTSSNSRIRHLVLFESGRKEKILLYNGRNKGDYFRVLPDIEARRHVADTRCRLERENQLLRQHVSNVQDEISVKAKETEDVRGELERLKLDMAERELCPVCLDLHKAFAFECGHRVCGACVDLFVKGKRPCPICRKTVKKALRVFG